MTPLTKAGLTLGGLLLVLGGGAFALIGAEKPRPSAVTETTEVAGSGILDGMTFASALGPRDGPADVEDLLIFARGTFVSIECKRRCGYPARPYFVRRVGNAIEFISETSCPRKNATIVWRGTVEDGAIEGSFTWTTERWYWTIEKEFWFEGTLVAGEAPLASTQ